MRFRQLRFAATIAAIIWVSCLPVGGTAHAQTKFRPDPIGVTVQKDTEDERGIGVGFGHFTENTDAFDLVITLNPPDDMTLVSSTKHDNDGDVIWLGPEKITISEDPKREKHKWIGAGALANLDHQVRFAGTFGSVEPQGAPSQLPTFHVGVVYLDIDVNVLGATDTGANSPPVARDDPRSLIEDKMEDESLGGVGVEVGMLPGNSYPDTIDMNTLVRPYKRLRVYCQPKWHESEPDIGTLSFSLGAWGPFLCAIYDPETGHRVTTLAVPTTGLLKDLAIVTNDSCLRYGSTTIVAQFTWNSQKVTSQAGASDIVRVFPVLMIEADVVDQPPADATYASGIESDDVRLWLNNVLVFPQPQMTPVANGLHLRYEAKQYEVYGGANTVKIYASDRATNGTSPDPFTWTFQLPE